MANPSIKNGYFPFSNEIAEEFARRKIHANEMSLIWVVIRKTWGWASKAKNGRRKDWDKIPVSQFVKMTGIKRRNVQKLLKSLASQKMLLKSENGYKFNQNYEEWGASYRMQASQKMQGGASQEMPLLASQDMHSKEKKEIYQKKENANSFFEMREEDFLEFWNIYPRKMNEDFAREEFFKIDRNVFPVLMEGLKEYISGRAKENIHGGMKPNVWLRDQMWQFSSSSNENK